jgi:protein-S-isoprenylcysteine O-methyltransferase Ste14
MRLFLFVHISVGALLLGVPNMTRRELLFAVPVPPNFRAGTAGRHAIAMFRIVVAAVVLAGACAILLSPAQLINAVVPVVVLTPVIAGGSAFYWQYRGWLRSPFSLRVRVKRS